MFHLTPLPTLLALNADSKEPADLSAAAAHAAAAAAHLSARPRDTDPGIKMAKALENLRSHPTVVHTAADDRIDLLHPARFLGGAVCSSKKLWLAAREVIGLDGVIPLSSYDMSTVGLGGCVTNRGWTELHNPASTSISLKMFSSSNMGTATAGTKRLTLADGEAAINVGEHLKEIVHMEEFKHAIRALGKAMAMALPWNRSIDAIDGWLHNSNYGLADLNGRPDRVPLLVDFVNYALSLNANAWQQREPFLGTGDIKTLWGEWYGSRPASYLSVPAYAPITQLSGPCHNPIKPLVSLSRLTLKIRGRDTYTLGTRPAFNRRAGFQLAPAPAAPANSGQPKPLMAPQHSPNPGPDQICRRFNAGVCPNHFTTCRTAAGVRLLHICDATNALGQPCAKFHARAQHR
jgi:hypothetical protein